MADLGAPPHVRLVADGGRRRWRWAASAVAVATVAVSVGCSPPTGPAPPSGLTASGRTGQVILDWDDGPSTVTGYRVARASGANGPYTSLTPEPITISRYHDTGTPIGQRSYYRVVAVAADGAASAPATANATAMGSSFGWTSSASSPSGHYEGAGVAVGERILVFGGYYNAAVQATTSVQAYDTTNGQWTDLAPLPQPLSHQAVVVDGGRVWLLGGYVGDHPGPSTDAVWVYDTTTDTYQPGPSLPAPRGAGTAAIVGRTLHYLGGATRTAGVLDDTDQPEHWVLDLDAAVVGPASTDGEPLPGATWEARSHLPTLRNHLGSAVLDGRIYLIGGQHGHHEADDQERAVEVYDPESETWTAVAGLPVGRGHVMWSVVTHQGHVIVAGGMTDGPVTSALVHAYDPLANVWVRLAGLPQPRKSPVVRVVGDRFVVTQGATSVPQRETWTGRLSATW
jgi:N-acetylneuraminic acid mutarotase